MKRRTPKYRLRAAAILAAAVPLAMLPACSSAPPAEPALAAGMASVEAARASGAAEYAAADLNDARAKLDRARVLAQAGRNADAIRLAEKADADAQLARARAGSERARLALGEVQASLATLREELRRSGSPTPGGGVITPGAPGSAPAGATMPPANPVTPATPSPVSPAGATMPPGPAASQPRAP